ncbi:hypothetical protein SNEBB_003783 [Seison nebaliae]|nr:hypothetical protein SNEBB_003783 [Seison nebaliae]
MSGKEIERDLKDNGGRMVILKLNNLKIHFGIDVYEFETGKNFRGIKQIPQEHMHRISFYKKFEGDRDLFAFNWNEEKEMLEEVTANETMSRVRDNLFEIDRHLGPYPYENIYELWLSFSYLMDSKEIHESISPKNHFIYSTEHLQPLTYRSTNIGSSPLNRFKRRKSPVSPSSTTHTEIVDINNNVIMEDDMNFDHIQYENQPKSLKEAEDRLPTFEKVKNESIRYTELTKYCTIPDWRREEFDKLNENKLIETMKFDDSISSMCHIDLSPSFFYINQRYNSTNGIVGELQFAFLSVYLSLHSESFEQWQKILRIFCYAEQAIIKHPDTYLNFVDVFYVQMKHLDSDLFQLNDEDHNINNEEDDDYDDVNSRKRNLNNSSTSNNKIAHDLFILFNNIEYNQHGNVDGKLQEKMGKFKNYIAYKYDWNLDNEPDDWKPQIVQLTDDDDDDDDDP